MKNRHQELLRQRMWHYHRKHPWDGGGNHDDAEDSIGYRLSWKQDFGFVLNGRRVMVQWSHPRQVYADTIRNAAWEEAGEMPVSAEYPELSGYVKRYRPVGRSRKQVVSYESLPMAPEAEDYYGRCREIRVRLEREGIDHVVRPSLSIRRKNWCTWVNLCLPIEVRNEGDVKTLADLVLRLFRNGRSLSAIAEHIPEHYGYGREQWLAEAEGRRKDREDRDAAYGDEDEVFREEMKTRIWSNHGHNGNMA